MTLKRAIVFTIFGAMVAGNMTSVSLAQKKPKVTSGKNQNRVLTPRQIAEKVLPSVVVVIAKDREGNAIAQGSGFFYEKRRPNDTAFDFDEFEAGVLGDKEKLNKLKTRRIWVVTNLHVLKRAWQAIVKDTRSGSIYEVRSIVGFDVKHDLCVLSLDDKAKGTPLQLSPSTGLAVGDDIYAAGNPKGLEGSFSRGIVSAIRRDRELIQVDAPISPGSSGGPIVNSRGEVVGVAVGTFFGGQNLNFAIPSEFLSSLILKRNSEVRVAGAFAVTSKDNEKLKGPVFRLVVKTTEYAYSPQAGDYQATGPMVSSIGEYDFFGNATQYSFYFRGNLTFKHIYGYGQDGCINQTTTVKPDGNREIEKIPEDECISRKLKANAFSDTLNHELPDGGTVALKYDRNGDKVEELVKGTSSVNRKAWKYDENGLVIEEQVHENGRLIETSRYTYEYDNFGNWISQRESTLFSNGPKISFLTRVTAREVSYFEN